MGILKYFKKGPYLRFFMTRADADDFVKHYVEELDGRVEYEFEIDRLDVRMIGLESLFGNVSAVATDNFDTLPDYVKKTPVFYITDDIRQALKAAHEAGYNVIQELTELPFGFQGRFELAAGYIVELAQRVEGAVSDDALVVVATGYSGPEVLRLRREPVAEPGPGEVLLEVRAAGVNPIYRKTGPADTLET